MPESTSSSSPTGAPIGATMDISGWRQRLHETLGGSLRRLALVYLLGITLAEACTVFVEPRLGLILHTLMLAALMIHSGRMWEQPGHRLLLALSLLPLIRIVSMSLPLLAFPFIYWFFVTSLPLFVATFVVMRLFGWGLADLGLSLSPRDLISFSGKGLPVQLLVGATGLIFGYTEYLILEPEPLVDTFSWQAIWLPALILLVSTGYMEELLFRQVLQRPAVKALGIWPGIGYGALLFAVFHIGYQSLTDVIFVFVVGFFFGWVVWKTNSLIGVTLSHGLTNIVLFLIMPFLAAGGDLPGLNNNPAAVDEQTAIVVPAEATAADAVETSTTTPASATDTELGMEPAMESDAESDAEPAHNSNEAATMTSPAHDTSRSWLMILWQESGVWLLLLVGNAALMGFLMMKSAPNQ